MPNKNNKIDITCPHCDKKEPHFHNLHPVTMEFSYKKGLVRIEKSDRITTPYNILLGDFVVALCPSEFTANLIGHALSLNVEYERIKSNGKSL